MLEARQISIRPARCSTWLFLFFKWSNFSPCWILWNCQRNVTLGAMAFLSNACQQQVDFMDSWAIVLPKFTGKLSPIEKTLRNTNLRGNNVDQISLSASSTGDLGSDYLSSLMRTQKRGKKASRKEMTELDFRCPISRSAILCSLPLVKLAVRSACVVVKAVVLLFLNLLLTFF